MAALCVLVRAVASVYPAYMRQGSPQHLGGAGKWNTEGVLLDESQAKGEIDLHSVFGNTRPVELEIGSGKGTFILERAASRPEVNLLGLEYAGAYCRYAADRVRRAGLVNVRLLIAEAGRFVTERLPDASLTAVHIYFPDPWPKRRHHRRRLIQRPFVRQLRRVLAPGGQLLIVTDHLGYFMHIRRVLDGAEGFARIVLPRMTDATGQIVGTNFERKYIAQGRAFYSIARLRYV